MAGPGRAYVHEKRAAMGPAGRECRVPRDRAKRFSIGGQGLARDVAGILPAEIVLVWLLSHHPLAADPKASFEHLLVDLADAGHRQLRHKFDVLWRMRRAVTRFHEVDQFLRVGPCALARDDNSGDGLAPFVVEI